MLVNSDFQTWHLIGWQHSRQPIRSHVRKYLLTNMEFNFYKVILAPRVIYHARMNDTLRAAVEDGQALVSV